MSTKTSLTCGPYKVEFNLKSTGNPMTVDRAKALIGWQAEDDEDAPKKGFDKKFTLRDARGVKVRLNNNVTNRPFRPPLARRYAMEMLRKKWEFNGETWIFDNKEKAQSAQHRACGLILAEQIRQSDPGSWRDSYGWRGPVEIEALVVYGIPNKASVVDTLDIGAGRNLADVLFRNKTFPAKYTARQAASLSNVLAGATRLVWLRQGGKTVSDAPWFPHSEAIDFIEAHPKLVDAAMFIFEEDGGKEQLVRQHISNAYAAGLLYLMGVSGTDPDKYADKGSEALSTKLWGKAEDFWVKFAQGAGTANNAESPLFYCRNRLGRIEAGGAMGRDEICGTVIKAFNLWADGKKAKSARDVTVKKTRGDGKQELAETPRLGGIDQEVVPEDPPADDTPEGDKGKAAAKKGKGTDRKGKKKGKTWGKGDTAWVNDPEDGPWFGTVKETSDDGKVAFVKPADEADAPEWETPMEQLTVEFPG